MIKFSGDLIAPCGMNCAICSRYLAFKHDVRCKGISIAYCPGCRARNRMCALIKKKCDLLQNDKIQYCFECKDYPCKGLQHLDGKYRSLFHMSEIDNLNFIKRKNIRTFLNKQKRDWKCSECGDVICCHNGICFNCGPDKLKTKKNKYRWED
jgi:hypothetical protein